MKKQTVFISGIAGFLGSHLADLMLSLGHTVIGCDNLSAGDLDHVPARAEFIKADLNDFDQMVKITRGADVVLHTAATAYDGLSWFSPYHITQNVFSNSVSLISASVENRAKRFVYFSSMARYGRLEHVPFYEDMTPLPDSPYGIAKLAAEQTLRQLARQHGMEFVICVPHNIIGPRQKYDDPFRNVAAIMINRMMQGQQPVIYGDGMQKRCFSFVQDALQIMEHLTFDSKANGEIINIGPDEEFVTILDLARNIASIMNFDLKPDFFPARPGEARLANCSAEKARRLFGYKTDYPLEKGLREMVEWMQARGPKPFAYDQRIEIHNAQLPKTWAEQVL